MSSVAALINRVLHGRYRVDSHLAEGGMASVYCGHDLRLDRPIALKVMRPDLAQDVDFVERFQREAVSAAKLSHPHVVSVYDQGEDQGLVYLVMELVTGRNLRDIIHDEAPLTLRAATDVVDQILAALSAAHRGRLIHRDIKPENVLTDAAGSVKVADFGLARAITAGTMSRTSDVMWGTAAYLSPEQVQHGRADARTDVYAVGLVLYELLTGRKAFDGVSPIHVAFRHVHETVPSLTESVPDIPGEMDVLIARATATEPDDRPEDAIALRDHLASAIATLSEHELDAAPVLAAGAHDDTSARSLPPPEASGSADVDATRPVQWATTAVPIQSAASPGNFARTTGNNGSRSDPTTSDPSAYVHAPGPDAAPVRQRRQRRQRRRGVGVILAVLLVLIGGGGAATAWYFTAGPGVFSPMPNVVGTGEKDAVEQLRQAKLKPEAVPAFSETEPDGTIIAASQDAGEPVRHGSTVEIQVSSGPERYSVPDLVGLTVPEATEKLASTSLAPGDITEDFDGEAPRGQVLRSSPKADDEEVAPDTKVDLVLSAGPEPIDIPDVVSLPEGEAQKRLTDAGFTFEIAETRVNNPDTAAGTVASQQPASGQGTRGDVITLTISKGPALVQVPRVVGMQYEEAKQLLEGLGLKVIRKDIAKSLFNTVRTQNLKEGEQVPPGTKIVLRVL